MWNPGRQLLTSTLCTSSRRIQQISNSKSTQPSYIYKMNEAYLRFNKGQETFDFTLRYVRPELKIDRHFNFNRRAAESVSTFLKRIDTNIGKFVAERKRKVLLKKKKKAQGNVSEQNEETMKDNSKDCASLKVALLRNEENIEDDITCEDAFENVGQLQLLISDSKYSIKHNVPWVNSISLPQSILVGFPTYPSIFEASYTNIKNSTFVWYKNLLSATPNKPPQWKEIGKEYFYIPSIEDMGFKLKFTCIPGNKEKVGPFTEVEAPNLIEAGPGRCPFEDRHAFTPEKLSGSSFRVMSYNLLADTYADSDYSRKVLFPYCPPYALHIDYRKQLILKEIIGFNSDIICLQEVDNKIYTIDYEPTLSVLNYDSVFNRKGTTVVEGLSTFFNTERFEKISFDSVVLSENLDLEKFKPTWDKIENEKMKTRFKDRNTAVQVTILRFKENPSEILVVGNTHLYFHPNADHIRLLQGFYIVNYVEDIAKKYKEQNPDSNVSIILCGDFNSVPECGIYKLMTTKFVPSDYKDWNSFPEEAVTNISLSQDTLFASACGTPEHTNYTVEFSGCLDYIYYQTEQLEVQQVIPMPSQEELALNTAIPSVVFPSDHVSLCADLKLKERLA